MTALIDPFQDRSGWLTLLRDNDVPDPAKTLLTYVYLTGAGVWSGKDLALDLGWNVQRVGYAVGILRRLGFAERERVPVLGGFEMRYTFFETETR